MAQSDDSKTVESATESNTDREGCYDVFLSFHDSDTGYGFCDYLYRALCDADISTFRMHEEPRGRSELDKLKTEEEIYQAKAKAVEECKVAVVILSERYGESKWCLRDLTKIAARRRKDIKDIMVIPIFYYVNIDEVKAINSDRWCYKKFFDKHKDVIADTDLKEWRVAFKIFTGDDQSLALRLKKDEGPFHSITVKEALKSISWHVAIRKVYVSGTKSKKNEELKQLISKTQETQNVRIIIVVGLSGSGKTNIVGHTYNEEKDRYRNHCFLKDVGCTSENDLGTMRLQQQIVLCIKDGVKVNAENIHKGRPHEYLIEVIKNKMVFIVLDNVNSISEIERLVNGGMDTFEKICQPGSLFIITTTNKDILSGSKLITHICEVDSLPDMEARILFCQHAFKTDNPPEEFDSQVDDVVLLAGGLPLTLVILGSSIFNEKDKDARKAMFDKIKDVPCREAHDRLRIGYDALDYAQKQIFLDIACFFAGTSKEYPIYMWENCGFHPEEGIKILQSRSLITIGKDDSIISMNLQLIKLGRQIVKEKADEPYYKVVSKRSRLWDQHDALEVLTKFQRAENVEALSLNMKLLSSDEFEKLQHIEGEYRPYEARVAEKEQQKNMYILRLQSIYLRNLSSLRFLQLGQVSLYGDFQQLFSKLKWLRWTCCEQFIKHDLKADVRPITFFPENLVILDLSKSTITDEWEHWESFKVAENLKVLDLSFCDKIGNLDCSKQTQLEVLNLDSCTSLTKIMGLEKSRLSLKYLNVENCSTLSELPDFSRYKNLSIDHQGCRAEIRGWPKQQLKYNKSLQSVLSRSIPYI